jgi:hypothetical protein
MPKPPLILPVAEFMPDQPTLNNPGSANILNVIPRTRRSYGPFPGMAVTGNALASRCQGAGAFEDSSGNISIFAGDATHLWKYAPGSAAPSDISIAGGYSIAGDQRWVFTQFGQRVIATDFADAIQAYTLGVSAKFAALAAAAPNARYLASVTGFLAAANTNDAVNGLQPQRVWWSATNDPTTWPTPGTSAAAQVQSSFNDLFGDFGWIQGIVGATGPSDGLVFMERGIYRMNYVGPPVVFAFPPSEGARGTPAPGSIVPQGVYVYYLGEDGFYRHNGIASEPIGVDRVDRFFWANVDTSNLRRIQGAVDPVNRLIIWAVPFTGNSGGNPNVLLCYSPPLDRWVMANVTCETVFRAFTFGYTLDQLFTQLGYTIDNLPFPLDSRAWTGGAQVFAGFDAAHKLNLFNGANLAPVVETTELQPFPGRRAFVRNSRALVDGGVASVAISRRDRLVDLPVYAPPSKMNALGTSPQRLSGRYLRASISEPAGSAFTNIQGVEVEGDPQGFR